MEEALVKRIMPNSLEAEQSVIGSMIMDKDAIVTAMEMLISEDFYHTQYGILFDTMIELYNKGLPVDLVTLQNKLKEKDVPPEIASLEFVRDLGDGSTDFGECEVLCTDRQGQLDAQKAHQAE